MSLIPPQPEHTGAASVEMLHFSKRFGALQALDDVSMTRRGRQLPRAAGRKRRRQVHAGQGADRLLQRRHRPGAGRRPRAGHPQPARCRGAGPGHDLPALHRGAGHVGGREPGAGAARPGCGHRLEGRARAPGRVHGHRALPAEAGRARRRAGGRRKAEARDPEGAVRAPPLPGAGRADLGADAAGSRRGAGPDEGAVPGQAADGADHHAQVPRGLRLLRRGHRAAPRPAHRRGAHGADLARRTGRLDDGRRHRRGVVHQRGSHRRGGGHGGGQQCRGPGRGAGRRPSRPRRRPWLRARRGWPSATSRSPASKAARPSTA